MTLSAQDCQSMVISPGGYLLALAAVMFPESAFSIDSCVVDELRQLHIFVVIFLESTFATDAIHPISVLPAISFWGLAEPALECPNKTGMVSISNHECHFFDLHVRGGEKICGHSEPALTKQLTEVHSCFLLEQSLQVSRTQMD